MWKFIILIETCFLITATFTSNSLYSVNPFSSATCEERQLEGIFCQTCEIISTCVKMNNEWLTIPVKSCEAAKGLYCNMFYNGCSNNTGPCNPVGHEINFMCNAEGIFPDPYDCQKYHFCFRPDGTNLVSINLQCPGNSAFSVQTNECNTYINAAVCMEKQFQCFSVGDQNPWPGNSNIFYICASTSIDGQDVLFPLLFRCPVNQVHNGLRCASGSGGGDQTTSTATSTETLTTTNTPEEFVCLSFGLFPHPTNCRLYYICNENLVYKIGTCPADAYFSFSQQSCILGVC